VIRAANKKQKVFPSDDSVRKVIYLANKDASKNGVCRARAGGWQCRFIIEFGDRLSDHL